MDIHELVTGTLRVVRPLVGLAVELDTTRLSAGAMVRGARASSARW